MKILLVNICLRYDSEIKQIPVGLSCIATALKQAGFNIDILDIDLHRYKDAEVEMYLEKNNYYDMVGFGNIVSGYKFTKKLAKQIKNAMPETVLVVGNTVATSMPEFLLKHVPEIDIAVIGEGDITVVELADAISKKNKWTGIDGIAYREDNTIVTTKMRKAIHSMLDISFPDYSLFEVEKYLSVSKKTIMEPLPPLEFDSIRALPVNTARGCLFNCTFCGHAFKRYPYRHYPFDVVLKHIKHLQERYSVNFIHFWDELTISSPARLEELCEAIDKHKVYFYWNIQTRANVFKEKDLHLLKRSKECGAMSIGGALESADEEILKAMNKLIRVEDYIKQVQVAKRAGLSVFTSLVFGYPQETKNTIRKTFDICRQLEVYPSIGFLLPLPNTTMYRYAIEKGFIKDEEKYLLNIADRQDLHINLTEMENEELYNLVNEEAIRLKNELGINLSEKEVIKTGRYKTVKR